MNWARPKSLMGLMLLGLLLIAVPLLVAVFTAALQIRALADTGQKIVVEGVTRSPGRWLVEKGSYERFLQRIAESRRGLTAGGPPPPPIPAPTAAAARRHARVEAELDRVLGVQPMAAASA